VSYKVWILGFGKHRLYRVLKNFMRKPEHRVAMSRVDSSTVVADYSCRVARISSTDAQCNDWSGRKKRSNADRAPTEVERNGRFWLRAVPYPSPCSCETVDCELHDERTTIAVAMSGGVDSSTVAACSPARRRWFATSVVGLTSSCGTRRGWPASMAFPMRQGGPLLFLDDVYDARPCRAPQDSLLRRQPAGAL